MAVISFISSLKKFIIRKWKMILVFIVVVLLVGFFAGRRNSDVTLESLVVEQSQTVTQTVEARGTVRLGREVALGFEVGGRVSDVLVRDGDTVVEGQVLARVENASARAEVARAKAALAAALADGDASTVDIESAERQLARIAEEEEVKVANAYEALLNSDLEVHALEEYSNATAPTLSGTYTGAEGVYRIQIYRSNAPSGYSYNITGLEEGVATVTTDSASPLGSSGLFIQFDADSSYNNTYWEIPIPNVRSGSYQAAASTYTNTLQARDTRLANVEDDLERLKALDSGASGSKSAALISQARANVNAAEAALAKYVVKAPFDGVVSSVGVDRGETVSVGQSFAVLADPGAFEVSINIPEVDVAKVAIDMPAQITVDAFGSGRVWMGGIDFIDIIESYVDGVPVYKATVGILDSTTSLRAGMNATVAITTAEYPDVVAVPSSYIFEGDEGEKVVRLQALESENGFIEKAVQTGFLGDAEMTIIESGLVGGEIVVREQAEEGR